MTIKLIAGDCRDVLPTLAANSVQCVVTSPPYYGLRDYGTAQWDGGDPGCDHLVAQPKRGNASYTNGQGESYASNLQAWGDRAVPPPYRDVCGKCGARRIDRQIGLEATPDDWLATMVGVMREVRRVLHDTGTVFLNVGNSYQDKQLLMMPARLALALQADGWWLRSAIVWAKPNPMPESVVDRPTSAYEMVYLLAKGQWRRRTVKLADLSDDCRHLEFNGRQTDASVWADKIGFGLARSILDCPHVKEQLGSLSFDSQVGQESLGTDGGSRVGDLPPIHNVALYASHLLRTNASAKQFLCELHRLGLVLSKRDSFRIVGVDAEFPYPVGIDPYGETSVAIHDAGKIGQIDFVHGHVVAHVATTCTYFYDADAVREPHVDAERGSNPATMAIGFRSTLDDGMTRRGAWVNDTARSYNPAGRSCRNVWTIATHSFPDAHFATYPPALAERCIKAGSRPGDTILDPFAGAGTTLLVADRLQRDVIGIELNTAYTEMAMERCRNDAPLFSAWAPAEDPEDERMRDLFEEAAD